VAVQEGFPSQLRRLVLDLLEELAEVEGLLRESLSVFVEGQQLLQLVFEDRDATGLDANDRGARADLVAELVDDLLGVAASQAEHPVVVERPAAAEVELRDDDGTARVLERLDDGRPDGLVEVVRECV